MHADEIGYLFKQDIWKDPMSADDILISDRMTNLWTNFVKFGNPTPEVTELLPYKWIPATLEFTNYFKINKEMSMAMDPNKERMEFWNLLVAAYFDIDNARWSSVFCELDVSVVKTKFGNVRGVYEEDENGEYIIYMGIPYGQPPKDNLFGDPMDPDTWDGVFEANSDSSKCPQREEFNDTFVGDPHCLHLNVYVPANRTSSEPMSVLFWIHGGGFTFGFGGRYQWGPEYLIRHDIIMVAINYRLGPYGFMCLGTKKVPGNSGLKDVLKSLRWVKDNIAAFGGNPEEVTIGGSSAGALIVEYLLLSPNDDGLYQRAILESGSDFFEAYISNHNDDRNVLMLASHFGYEGNSTEESLDYLQIVDPLDLIAAVENLSLSFEICYEREVDNVENFITEGHTKTLSSGDFEAVDVLLGFNNKELWFFGDVNETNVDALFESAFEKFSFGSEDEQIAVFDIVRRFYIGSQPLSEELRESIAMFRGDAKMIYPIYLSLQYFLKKNINAYYYEFSYDGGRNFAKSMGNIRIEGALHADEIGYLFKQGVWEDPMSADDALISDRMTTLWTNFVKYGNPTPEVTALLPVKWEPATAEESTNYLKINKEMSMAIDPHKERIEFWNLLVAAYFDIDNV